MDTEIWKDIIGHTPYQASNFGNIRSKGFGWRKGRTLKKYIDWCGYEKVNLCDMEKQKTYKVHRLICQTFLPNPENKPEVNHKNGVKTDNRVENLEWCTREENINHRTIMHNNKKSYLGK